jgi:hypothetical protein
MCVSVAISNKTSNVVFIVAPCSISIFEKHHVRGWSARENIERTLQNNPTTPRFAQRT